MQSIKEEVKEEDDEWDLVENELEGVDPKITTMLKAIKEAPKEEEAIVSPNRLCKDVSQFIKSKCKYAQPIATVFFRFSHRSYKGGKTLLTNQEQKEIVDKIYKQLTINLEKEAN
jgi:hypothetical protein